MDTKDSQLLADINYNLKFTKLIFKPLGIWPVITKDPRFRSKLSSTLIISVNACIIFTIIMPYTINMLFKEKDTAVKIILLGPFGFWFTNSNHLETDWARVKTKEDREKMIKSADTGHRITKLSGIFIFSGVFSYHTLMPVLSGSRINEFNQTIRPLVYPGGEIFVDVQTSPVYELMFLLHFTYGMINQALTAGACHIAAIFACHACGQIDVLKSELENLSKEENYETNSTVDHRIASITQNHVRIMDLTKNIEKMLREICLAEVGVSTIVICLLEYYCLAEWKNSETVNILTYLMLLVALSFNMFIFCYIGEILNQQSASIGESAYMINWYEIPQNKGKYLTLAIASSASPRQLTAGGMMDLTLRNFGNIIKTSVAYLNMLRTVDE